MCSLFMDSISVLTVVVLSFLRDDSRALLSLLVSQYIERWIVDSFIRRDAQLGKKVLECIVSSQRLQLQWFWSSVNISPW